MRRFRLSVTPAGAALIAGLLAGAPAPAQDSSGLPVPPEDLPDAFTQLVPRGKIPSVDSPEFVKAADADLPGDAWVLGVVIQGQARAYSLNLLNRHEVVNDRIGETAFAAVW